MNNTFEVIIIGSGPAAYTAGIYTSRGNVRTLILEGYVPGGQLLTTTTIENFPGFEEIDGVDLMIGMKHQAQENGCQTISKEAVQIIKIDEGFQVIDSEANEYLTKSIILAMGANAKRLEFPGSTTFWNKGISACAVCDGALPIFRDKVLIVIGGGDTAMEEAMYLSKFASRVLILVRSGNLRASKVMIDRVRNNSRIEMKYHREVILATGDSLLRRVTIRNRENGEENEEIEEIECGGIFYAIGHSPNTGILGGLVETDERGYILRQDFSTRTNVSGIFAAGDISDSIYRQAITAAGSGCMAGLDAIRYLEGI